MPTTTTKIKTVTAGAGHGYYTFSLESYEDFLQKVVPSFSQTKKSDIFVWRGVRDPSWKLHSSLTRRFVGLRESREDWQRRTCDLTISHLLQYIQELRGLNILTEVHMELVRELSIQLRQKDNRSFYTVLKNLPQKLQHTVHELISGGQHFNLATPFLDWSLVPQIALYFAFREQGGLADGVGHRVVYALNKTAVEHKTPPEESGADSLAFFNSLGFDNPRIIAQQGLFTFVPAHMSVDEWVVNTFEFETRRPVLIRFLIRNDKREACLKDLDKSNINTRTIFPDREGASTQANYEMENLMKNE